MLDKKFLKNLQKYLKIEYNKNIYICNNFRQNKISKKFRQNKISKKFRQQFPTIVQNCSQQFETKNSLKKLDKKLQKSLVFSEREYFFLYHFSTVRNGYNCQLKRKYLAKLNVINM